MDNFIFSARNIVDDSFGNDADARVHYLVVPDEADTIQPLHEVEQGVWINKMVSSPESQQDILIFVHGYNVSENDLFKSHKILKQGLSDAGYTGQLVSFDWPCGQNVAAYLEDRYKAAQTAWLLVKGGISILAARQNMSMPGQTAKCKVNTHILAHSTGAFVVREAFENADNANNLHTTSWMVSQVVFISGDISSKSMILHSKCDALYDHSTRLTNFQNPYDQVLALSNVKRIGFENRVGRIGLPDKAPDSCVNVNSGDYFQVIKNNCSDPGDPIVAIPYSHSWYFDPQSNSEFIKDLYYTLQGDIDRNVIPTREIINGELRLKINNI